MWAGGKGLKQLNHPQEALLCWYWLARGGRNSGGKKNPNILSESPVAVSQPYKGNDTGPHPGGTWCQTAGLDRDKGSALRQAVAPG